MLQADNHHLLLAQASTMAEKAQQLDAAFQAAAAIEFEDGTSHLDLGVTLECVTRMDFDDGSRLQRRASASVWDDGAWTVVQANQSGMRLA